MKLRTKLASAVATAGIFAGGMISAAPANAASNPNLDYAVAVSKDYRGATGRFSLYSNRHIVVAGVNCKSLLKSRLAYHQVITNIAGSYLGGDRLLAGIVCTRAGQYNIR